MSGSTKNKKYIGPYASLREYLEALEKFGRVLHINDIDQDQYEATGFMYRLMEKYSALMQQLDQKYHLGIYTDEHQALANLAKKSGIFLGLACQSLGKIFLGVFFFRFCLPIARKIFLGVCF